MIDRIPPQNVEAEQSVLGAMLLDGNAIDRVAEILRPEDFYRQDNRVIYEAILALRAKSQAVDLVTVTEELRHLGKLDEVGWYCYNYSSVQCCAYGRQCYVPC
jgi:replicative DNA helicase